jgi:hypothetical protein
MATSSVQMMYKFCEDIIMSWTMDSVISRSLAILLLCYLKENVYKNIPQSIEPKQNIQGCILNAKTAIPHKVASSMWKTVDACIAEHGEHFQNVLCKSVSIISIVNIY